MPTPTARVPLGISLQGFYDLLAAHGGRGAFEGLSTDSVKSIVLAVTGHTRTSYAAQLLALGSPHVAPATAFISHAYSDMFLGVLDAVAALEEREGTSAFYYFDLLVVNQHAQGAKVPFEVLRDEFWRSVYAIGRTLLVLRWANPVPLQRAWCVFEMATTLAVKASLTVLMPPSDAEEFKMALRKDFDSLVYKTCRVDVEKASAREQEDLENIHLVIKEAGGFLKTNQLVIGAMQSWMVSEVRVALNTADKEPAKLNLMMCLANLLHSHGKLGEAESLYRVVLAARRCMPRMEEHLDTLGAINNLAALLKDLGKLEESELLYLEALTIYRRKLGEHPDTFDSINNLATLLSAQGKYHEAEPLYLEALAGRRRVLTNEHSDTLASMNNLATLFQAQGKLEEAKLLYHEALTIYRRMQGKDHPDTLCSINNLAILLSEQGNFCEAELLYREALAGRRKVLGNEHPNTLCTMNNLATLLKDQHKLDESEALFIEALAIYQHTLGAEHPALLNCIFNYASLLMKQGKKVEALEHYCLELEGVRRVFGEDHPSTQQSLRNFKPIAAIGLLTLAHDSPKRQVFLSQILSSLSHPHPLVRVIVADSTPYPGKCAYCDLCGRAPPDFVNHCSKCKFDLCEACFSLGMSEGVCQAATLTTQ